MPPNGHTNWITVKDVGSTAAEEIVGTNITGLTISRSYEVVIYSMSLAAPNYSPQFTNFFDYKVGTYPRVSITAVIQESWGTDSARFVADNTTMSFSFFLGNDMGSDFANLESVNLAVTINAVYTVPVADDNSDMIPINIANTFNVTATDVDFDGNIDDATVDLDPLTSGIQTSIITSDGTWTSDSLGNVTFDPALDFTGTATLDYTVNDDYELDGTPQPATSNIAVLTAAVTALPIIVAEDDDFSSMPIDSAAGGTTISVFENNGNGTDTADGAIATDANISDNISISDDDGLMGVTINTDGIINIPAGTPAESYVLQYTICLEADPIICTTAEVTIDVDPTIDVSVSKTLVDSSPYSTGDTVTYVLVVSNAGPDLATNVEVSDTPNNLTITSVSGGGCTTFPCTIGSLVSGTANDVSIIITATIGAAGAFTNLASVGVDETDSDGTNDTDDGTDGDNNGIALDPLTIDAIDDDFTGTPLNPVIGGTTSSVFDNNGNGTDAADGLIATDANISNNILLQIMTVLQE